MNDSTAVFRSRSDWRMRISIGLTAGWLGLGFVYVSLVVGWADFVSQNAPSLGAFLEGAFAPLAFLWLVVGFFLQQQQLQENTRTIQQQLEQMRRTTENIEVQTRHIVADELHSRQDTFLRINELVAEQLGTIAGWIITSYLASSDQTSDLWRRMGGGEHTAFSMDAIRRCLSNEVEPTELFWGTEIRSTHTRRFIAAFERVLEAADHCDSDGIIATALRDGAHGRVCRLMTESVP